MSHDVKDRKNENAQGNMEPSGNEGGTSMVGGDLRALAGHKAMKRRLAARRAKASTAGEMDPGEESGDAGADRVGDRTLVENDLRAGRALHGRAAAAVQAGGIDPAQVNNAIRHGVPFPSDFTTSEHATAASVAAVYVAHAGERDSRHGGARGPQVIVGDPIEVGWEKGKDGARQLTDTEAATAFRMLNDMVAMTTQRLHQGLENALASKICREARALSKDAMAEVAKSAATSLWEKAIHHAGEAAEGAAAPVMATWEIGSLAEAVHEANVKVSEAATINQFAKRYQAGIAALAAESRERIARLDGQMAVDLVKTARVRVTEEGVAHEFEAVIEEAMILHGYSARDAIEHVRSKLDGEPSPEE